MPIKYNKTDKCFEITGFTHSSSYEEDTLSTDYCPISKDFCRKFIIGADTETLKCNRFLGTIGEEHFRTYPIDRDLLHDFKILCKGSNSMEFITED